MRTKKADIRIRPYLPYRFRYFYQQTYPVSERAAMPLSSPLVGGDKTEPIANNNMYFCYFKSACQGPYNRLKILFFAFSIPSLFELYGWWCAFFKETEH